MASAQPKNSAAETTAKKKLRARDEIDEIFERKKAAKKLQGAVAAEAHKGNKRNPSGGVNPNKGKKKKRNSEKKVATAPPAADEGGARRPRTKDGMAIYSVEELGFGKSDAGGTPLCPFDCSCCF